MSVFTFLKYNLTNTTSAKSALCTLYYSVENASMCSLYSLICFNRVRYMADFYMNWLHCKFYY